MSQDKKPQVDDLTKLRRILDNSSDPTLESLLSTNEKALESVRRRLHGDTVKTPSQSAGFFPHYSSMQPRVFIREQTTLSPRFKTTPPTVEPPASLPTFKLVSTSEPLKHIPSQEITFDSQDLLEVEKVDRTVPEFAEVTPEEPSPPSKEKDTQIQNDEHSAHEPELPEWQPVKEEQQTEQLERQEKLTSEGIPEFERISIPLIEEKQEIPIEKEPVLEKQEPTETTATIPLAEQSERSFQILSKWQKLKEKRAKEKQAKQLEKIKQEQITKAEAQQEKKTMAEQPPPPQEEIKTTTECVNTVETPWMKEDLDAFKGIECIDEKTAELLYKYGYFSIENIKDATLDDLVQIRGIRRKLAKQIKKEIEQKNALLKDSDFVPIKQKSTNKKSTKKLLDAAEWESYPVKEKPKQSPPSMCTYKGYTLFKKETKTRDRKKTTIHFFSKEKPDNGMPAPLPKGYQIAVNKKTGVPYLKKIR